jgi:hypothetical protein
MTPTPTPPPPGSMTVPPVFGWEDIATVLVVVLVLAAVAFLALAAGRARTARSDWQAWLDARSSMTTDLGTDRDQGPR